MIDDLARERDYFQSLVELSTHERPEPLLRRALSILVELSGAREAYIELQGGEGDAIARWSAAEGCDAVRIEAIREVISRGIIAEAIETGTTIVTASALADPRFQDRGSVKDHAIEAVLCAPIGREDRVGVVYLQGSRQGEGFVPFSAELRGQVDLFARSIGPIAELLVRKLDEERCAPVHFDGAFTGIVAQSVVVHDLIERLRLVAKLDVQVLLTGPSGAGKTVLAHAIHAESKRRARPFVELNCAAIPDALLENELFGADSGAHSAAPRGGIRGKVEAAEGGTLFLDEVGELSLSSQAKLLQLLQDRTYYRLGSTVLRRADVRIVAATNVSLPVAIAERRFREDLYYRLKVFEARVPALSERKEDIGPLAIHFCRSAAARHDFPPRTLSPAALRTVQTLEWPGNVRELAHRIESAVLNAHLRGVDRVERRDIVAEEPEQQTDALSLTLQEATRRFQRQHVLSVLESTEWNITEAARRLDVARSYLYTLMRVHELARAR